MSLDNALKIAEGMGDWLVDQTIEICKIPAPGFEEKERADYVAARMKEFAPIPQERESALAVENE